MESLNIKIKRDTLAESPRRDENLGVMVCWHNRHFLGDKTDHEKMSPHEWFEENLKDKADVVWLPIYMYDHSGITIKTTPFGDPWDSGQVGWIYVTEERYKEFYNLQGPLTDEQREKVAEQLRNEVRLYDQYLTGEVWMYELVDEGVVGPFYGSTLEETGMLHDFYEADWPAVREAWEKRE